MSNWIRTIAAVIALPALFALGACKGDADQEVGEATYELEVTNPMPHTMTVYAEYTTGHRVALGTVEPMGTTTFTITGPGSTRVKLMATDEAASHEVTGEARLRSGAAATWTIGG